MSAVFLILGFVAMAGVVVSLFAGLLSMSHGGPFNQRHGNRLMQARVMLQGLAIVLLALAAMTAGG